MCYRCTALGKAFAVAPGQKPNLPLPLKAGFPCAHFDFPFAQGSGCVTPGRGLPRATSALGATRQRRAARAIGS